MSSISSDEQTAGLVRCTGHKNQTEGPARVVWSEDDVSERHVIRAGVFIRSFDSFVWNAHQVTRLRPAASEAVFSSSK